MSKVLRLEVAVTVGGAYFYRVQYCQTVLARTTTYMENTADVLVENVDDVEAGARQTNDGAPRHIAHSLAHPRTP